MKIFIGSILFFLIAVLAYGQEDKIKDIQASLPTLHDSSSYVNALNKISLLFYEQNIDSTFSYAVRARNIASRHQYAQGMADATNNLGVTFDIKGNMQMALRYYGDAFNQYKTLKDSSNIVQTLMNIGSLYSLNESHEKAIKNYNRALSMGNKISQDSIMALVIYNYLLSYPSRFNGAETKNYMLKAEQIAKKYNDLRLTLALEQLRAKQMIDDNRPEDGIKHLESILRQAKENKLFYLSMDIMLNIGEFYEKSDQQHALQFYKEALDISRIKGYLNYTNIISTKLYHYYNDIGDLPNAFYYSQLLIELHDQQSELDKLSGVDYIEYAIKDQQLVSERLKSTYNAHMLWLALAVCALTILSIIFLYRNWKLTKRTNGVLRMQFQQLETATNALEKSNQNYARLIKMVAHDLRNPIGAINSMSTLLLEDELTVDDAREFNRLILDSSNDCIKMISDLLETDFSFKASELSKEPMNLTLFLQQAVKLLNFRADTKNQKLILKDTAEIEVIADRDKLLRALNNLIVNAIKFSPEGETIIVQTHRKKNDIIISIKDSGLGIPPDVAGRLFDPFTSAKRQGTSGEQPFGLGLYITKQIIEAHEGRIWFESEPGKGTIFFISLPGIGAF